MGQARPGGGIGLLISPTGSSLPDPLEAATKQFTAKTGWRQLRLEGSDSYNSRFLGDAVDGDDRRRRSCHQTSLATAMISPQQYRKLMKQFQLENHIGRSAIKALV